MRRLADSMALIIVTAWVGGLWAIGGIATLVLFSSLSDTSLAGMLAGKMLERIAYFGTFSACCLLLYHLWRMGSVAIKQWTLWLVVAMLLLTLVQLFGIQPILASIKLQANGTELMQSAFADRFQFWHNVASALYLVKSLLGGMLVIKWHKL